MNARVKMVTAAQDAVDREDGLVVVGVVKNRTHYDHVSKRLIRWVIVERANKDLPHQPEAASERNEINEGIVSGRDQID
jgi:hypothetical protein